MDRRQFLAAAAGPILGSEASAALAAAAARGSDPGRDAADEALWLAVAAAFAPDRSLINLNHGGCSPTSAAALAALKRHLDFSNKAPPYAMWKELEPHKEVVRGQLARLCGAQPDEIAIVRNTTEALHICQNGFDLRPGDEVLTTNQDYPRMRWAFRQRAKREGIVVREIPLPVPCADDDEVVQRFTDAVTPRTRLILVCHVVNLTGQVLPAQRVVELGRARGIPVLVDGAHAFAHLDVRPADLGCDYYASSLHKWLAAPVGSGLLFVRRDKVAALWPLHAADDAEAADDIRKFEQFGTHPIANFLAIAEAVALHEMIGAARKEARLRHLRDAWAQRLLATGKVRLLTSLEPARSCGLATMAIDGVDPERLAEFLWEDRKILVAAIRHPDVSGIRVSPNVTTTAAEIDAFCSAIEHVLARGLPP
jgi:selenocysteine lyase/cysteine desulfurase